MQLTRLDRWLRERFVHETHVYTMRPPPHVPPGARFEELPDKPGAQYRCRYILTDPQSADQLVSILKGSGQMFTTRVVDRNEWYVPLLAPANNRSVTWWVVGNLVSLTVIVLVIVALVSLWNDPEMRANIRDVIKTFKGS